MAPPSPTRQTVGAIGGLVFSLIALSTVMLVPEARLRLETAAYESVLGESERTSSITRQPGDASPVAAAESAMLQRHDLTRPGVLVWLELVLFVALAAYLALLVPRLPPWASLAVTLIVNVTLLAAGYLSLRGLQMWVQLAGNAFSQLLGWMLVAALCLPYWRVEVASKTPIGQARTLLAEGQLDHAFSILVAGPTEPESIELLYRLGLAYERDRNYAGAAEAYRTISDQDPEYRDVKTRLQQATSDDTVVMGSAGGGRRPLMVNQPTEPELTTLGRYVVEREIGKGAMGVVYLGRDPRINRVVAIKAIALAEEFHGDEVSDARHRFFREAETAGRLSHPDIVTVYDVGEDQGLAYIAMEFLRGWHLNSCAEPDNLLDADTVLDLAARAADALHYAHSENVVHRDIKPANIVYDSHRGNLKITDFGIARLTDNSRTKTGIVLGTPSYMSPEQLEGENVNGRSDLFSLGVTLYQLLTGHLPFQAKSMTQLMFRIANSQHRPITEHRPDLSPELSALIDRALEKDPMERFSDGVAMAAALRACSVELSTA